MKTKLGKINNYTGPSMNPTFKSGDGLIVEPYKGKKILCGDVITFRLKDREHNIVHRVIRVDRHCVRTMGDNNNTVDPWVLTPADITGRVVSVKRKHRELPVDGGLRGRIYGFLIRRYNMSVKKALGILHPLYRFISNTGIFRELLPVSYTRIFSFERPNGTELQLVMGKWLIARLLPGTENWQIRAPFGMFIDETNLNPEVICRQRKVNR
ncbi:MAG: signal peptidase I [Dissulfurispiraceae bacterium]|jgi:hypothetical protein